MLVPYYSQYYAGIIGSGLTNVKFKHSNFCKFHFQMFEYLNTHTINRFRIQTFLIRYIPNSLLMTILRLYLTDE